MLTLAQFRKPHALPILLVAFTQLVLYAMSSKIDLVARFRRLHDNKIEAAPFSFNGDVPSEIQFRLDSYGLKWADLSPYLQRALFWDSGYVLGDERSPNKVYVRCDVKSMNNIQMSLARYQSGGCTTEACKASQSTTLLRSKYCQKNQVDHSTNCATNEVTTLVDSSLWAEENPISNVVVEPVMRYHRNREDDWTVFAIHLVNPTDWNVCPASSDLMDAVILCSTYTPDAALWCETEPSATVDEWMVEEGGVYTSISPSTTDQPTSDTSNSTTIIIVVVSVIVVILLAIIVFFILRRKRRARNLDSEDEYAFSDTPSATVSTLPKRSSDFMSQGDTIQSCMSSSSSSTVEIHSRDWIPHNDIKFIQVIGAGSFGEVYVGSFSGIYVAVKKLHPWTKDEDLKEFEKETRILKSLNHPNILQYIGLVKLHSDSIADSICSVCEYMDLGDLRDVLRLTNQGSINLSEENEVCSKSGLARKSSFISRQVMVKQKAFMEMKSKFSWKDLKMQIAMDILAGLIYLHQFEPKIIHRDLKSRNVLLNSSFRAKLSDFGISREMSSNSSTMTVAGSNLWLAPEIICGENYDEKVDMFSFGIVLSEIDTHMLPYEGARTESGQPLHGMGILHHVAYKGLRPSLSDNPSNPTPRIIKEVYEECVNENPTHRPSAMEVFNRLRDYHYKTQLENYSNKTI